MITIRDACGMTLKELEGQNIRIVGLEADVASFTKSGILREALPERYLNVSIGGLSMVSMAAGFVREGMISHVNTFAVFMTARGADPIQSLIAYDNLNVELCGTYCSLSDSYDGASYQAITDLAFVRAIPDITVIIAADGVETRKAVFAVAKHDGPVYLRLSRTEAPVYYSDNMDLQIGRGIMVRGGGDVTIITTGTALHKILEAVDLLVQEGISATVVDMYIIKPVDRDLVVQCAMRAGVIIMVEEHSVYGGLDNTVAEVLMENKSVPMKRISAADFAGPGDYGELFVKYGYSSQATTGKCRAMIGWR